MPQRKLLGLIVLSLFACSTRGEEVNQIYTYSADLTRDGKNEKIVLAIHGVDIAKPLKWSLIASDPQNRTLYKVEGDDSWLDPFFGEEGYMSGCSGYEACKRDYYLVRKPSAISFCLERFDPAEYEQPDSFENAMLSARQFLQEQKFSSSSVEAALQELQGALKTRKTRVLCFEKDPEDHGKKLIWLATVSSFVSIYTP